MLLYSEVPSEVWLKPNDADISIRMAITERICALLRVSRGAIYNTILSKGRATLCFHGSGVSSLFLCDVFFFVRKCFKIRPKDNRSWWPLASALQNNRREGECPACRLGTGCNPRFPVVCEIQA